MTKANKIKHLLIASNAEVWGWFLFDWKTALRHKSLTYNAFLIDSKVFGCLAPRQLFPFWKQLEQSGSFIQIDNC